MFINTPDLTALTAPVPHLPPLRHLMLFFTAAITALLSTQASPPNQLAAS